jgi:hypothetical protein
MQKSSHNQLGISITSLRTQRFVDSAIHASPNFRQHKTDNSPAPLGPAEQKIALVYKSREDFLVSQFSWLTIRFQYYFILFLAE